MMLFELRHYRVMPGRTEDWVKVMEEDIIPFQASKGIVILGSWVGEEDPQDYIWIRRFENEEERKRLYEEVYESDHWKNVIRPKITGMLDSDARVVTRLTPTKMSPLR